MKDNNKYEQFETGEEEDDKSKKNKSKANHTLKYRIAIILLILLCACLLIIIYNLYTKEKLDNEFIKFLVVSDMHDNVESLDRLIKKVKSNKYNYIFYLGDFVKMTPGQQNSTEHAPIYQERIKQYLLKFEQIAPVLYIPGNNEPYTIYVINSPKLTEISKNIHNRYMKIKDGLYVMGIGGCVPILNGGKYDKNIIPFSTLNTSNVIQNGYPYNLPDQGLDNYKKSDEWYGNEIKDIIKKVKEDAKDNPFQTILLSHNGPLYSWTNAQQQLGTGENWLYLGSMELEKILINDENLIMDIHGHIHPSRGIVTMVPGKTVMNPGAIINGFYGELTLRKVENKWTVNSMDLLEF